MLLKDTITDITSVVEAFYSFTDGLSLSIIVTGVFSEKGIRYWYHSFFTKQSMNVWKHKSNMCQGLY